MQLSRQLNFAAAPNPTHSLACPGLVQAPMLPRPKSSSRLAQLVQSPITLRPPYLGRYVNPPSPPASTISPSSPHRLLFLVTASIYRCLNRPLLHSDPRYCYTPIFYTSTFLASSSDTRILARQAACSATRWRHPATNGRPKQVCITIRGNRLCESTLNFYLCANQSSRPALHPELPSASTPRRSLRCALPATACPGLTNTSSEPKITAKQWRLLAVAFLTRKCS